MPTFLTGRFLLQNNCIGGNGLLVLVIVLSYLNFDTTCRLDRFTIIGVVSIPTSAIVKARKSTFSDL